MTAHDNWKKFSAETTQALFVAVEEDDLVEANISLPQQIDLECSPESIRDNYALCLQFWEDGFSRRELLQLVNGFLQDPQLAAPTRMRYKYIRARYKHLRFAQQLYGAPTAPTACSTPPLWCSAIFRTRFATATRRT